MLNPKQRKALWKEKGGNLSAIAREAGVSVTHVRHVLGGTRRSPTIERMIAEVIGVEASEAFGPRLFKRQVA